MKRVLALLLTMTIACLAQAVPSTHDAESQFYRDSLKAIQNADDTYRDYDDFYQKLIKQDEMLPTVSENIAGCFAGGLIIGLGTITFYSVDINESYESDRISTGTISSASIAFLIIGATLIGYNTYAIVRDAPRSIKTHDYDKIYEIYKRRRNEQIQIDFVPTFGLDNSSAGVNLLLRL